MPAIFVNYRVKEQSGYAALLDRVLSDRFGADTVFRDFRSVRPGEDFTHRILESLRTAVVLLAVIGPGWAVSRRHRRDTEPPRDWVHRELLEAFTHGIRVVPVLVDGADLPPESDLPPDIATLSRCQALQVRHSSIEPDLDRLLAEVSRLMPNQAHRPGPPHSRRWQARLASEVRQRRPHLRRPPR